MIRRREHSQRKLLVSRGCRKLRTFPLIIGYVRIIQTHGSNIIFDLEEKGSQTSFDILNSLPEFIDAQLYEQCKGKDYKNATTYAYSTLEKRIHEKTSAETNISGMKLMDFAFDHKKGKLILGEARSERDAIYLLFQGALGLLQNQQSYHPSDDNNNIEKIEVVMMVDLLLRIGDKAKLRS